MAKKLAFGVEMTNRAYRLRYAKYMGLVEAVDEHIQKHCRPNQVQIKLLDIGPGRGRSEMYLSKHSFSVSEISFFGLDINERRLSSIRNPSRWHLIRSDAQGGLPFSSEVFDIVVCEQVLEHLTEPWRVVSEAGRVLRESGLLLLGVPTRPRGVAWIQRNVLLPLRRALPLAEGNHIQTFTTRTIIDLTRTAGDFEIQKVRGFRFMSGGLLIPFENWRWFWRLNRFLGQHFPYLCDETQIVAVKRNGLPSSGCRTTSGTSNKEHAG